MLKRAVITAFATLAIAAQATATTYGVDTSPDPFAEGKTCEKPELLSWGSYIFNAPSKYDLVFEPQTSPFSLIRCESSGYVSFSDEPIDPSSEQGARILLARKDADPFAALTPTERSRIAGYLRGVDGPAILKATTGDFTDDLLVHLERIYALRDMDAKFRIYLNRYLAWQYRTKPAADAHRQAAFDLYRKMPTGNWLKSKEDLERLYIMGFYARKLGRLAMSDASFRDLNAAWTLEFSTADYLRTLAREVDAGKADDRVRFAKGN